MAYECRSVCGETSALMPARSAAALTRLNAGKGGGLIFQSDHSVPSNVSGEDYDYVVKLVRQYDVVHDTLLLNSIASALPWFELMCGGLLVAGVAVAIAVPVLLVWHHHHSDRRATPVAQSIEPAVPASAGQSVAAANDTPAFPADSAVPVNATTLRLTILAKDANKPVAAVEVECATMKDKQKTQEKFLSRRDGICNVYYPKDAEALELVSRTDGFADTILHWEPAKGDTIPANYTLRLVRAVHMGGYVRDEKGAPVTGIKLEFRRNPCVIGACDGPAPNSSSRN